MYYNPEKYKDHDACMNRIRTLSEEIKGHLSNLQIDYLNKISGNIKEKRFNEITKSISIRMNSVIFHYGLLHSIYSPNSNIKTRNWNPFIGDQIAIQQKFIFDSIIFNSISIFDYLGCLIAYVREKNKNNWKKTWNSIEKTVRKDSKFNQTSLGHKIIEADNKWVKKLNEYRSQLIHYDTDYLPVSSNWQVLQGSVEILVKAPYQLKLAFRNLKKIEKNEDYNINAISLWLIESCLIFLLELLVELKVYIELNRIIPEEKAIITI